MPEVINKQRGGINVGGLQAQAVNPVQQVAPVSGSSFLSGLADIAEVGVSLYANKAAQDKAKLALEKEAVTNAAEQEAALGELAINRSFLESKLPSAVDKVADLSKEITGVDLDDDEKAALEGYSAFVERSKRAVSQGVKSEVAIGLARNKLQTDLITKYPGLTKEILAVSGTTKTLGKEALEVAFEDESFEREQFRAAIGEMGKELRAVGINTVGQDPAAIQLQYEEEFGFRRDLAQIDKRLQLVTAQNNLTSQQKTLEYDTTISQNFGVFSQMLNSATSRGLADGENATQKVQGALANIDKVEAELRKRLGGSPEIFDKYFGGMLERERAKVEDLATGKIDADAAALDGQLARDAAKNGVYTDFPGFLRATTLIDGFAPVIKEAILADPTLRDPVNDVIRAGLSAAQLPAPAPGAPEELPVVNVENDPKTNKPLSDKALAAKSNSNTSLMKSLYANDAKMTEEQRKAAVVSTISYLADSRQSNRLFGMHPAIEAMADPKFAEWSKPYSSAISNRAGAAMRQYVTQLNDSTAKLTKSVGEGNIASEWDKETGTLRMYATRKLGAGLEKEISDKGVYFTNYIRALAHVSGHTDYNKAMAGLFTGLTRGNE